MTLRFSTAWQCDAACVAALAALVATMPRAEPAAPAQKPCTAPEYRQFDFWLGDWSVANADGRVIGANRIESREGGCVLQEHWSAVRGGTGTSLSAWDAERQRWHQTWVDAGGGVALLDGAFADGRMVLAGDAIDREHARTLRNRITWIPLADGRVRQWWEQSDDGGATWKTVFDGYYSRRP
jgi:hypothetical protein